MSHPPFLALVLRYSSTEILSLTTSFAPPPRSPRYPLLLLPRPQLIETFGQDQISRRRVEAVREHWAATLKQRHAAGVKDEESAWVRFVPLLFPSLHLPL